MAKARAVVNINIKLYPDNESDAQLVQFLEDRPNTYMIKEALKFYMANYNSMWSAPPVGTSATPKS